MEVDKKYGLISNAIEAAKHLEFNLDFVDNNSVFYRVENLNLDFQSAYTASTFCSTFDTFFTNIQTKTIFAEKKSLNSVIGNIDAYIGIPIVDDWEITSETKEIDGFQCYKALGKKKTSYLDKKFEEEVIAWFCPKLPYSFGPTQYFGLPGLILEIQESKVVIGVKKIDLNRDVKINFDSNKKIITKYEYDVFIKNGMDKIQESIEKENK